MVKVTASIYKRSKNWVALLYIVDGINPPRRKSVTTDVPITKSEKTARKSAEEIRKRYEEELNNNLKVTQMAQNSNNILSALSNAEKMDLDLAQVIELYH